jgi:hypothetical protein
MMIKLAEMTPPINAAKRLTTLLSTMDVPLS